MTFRHFFNEICTKSIALPVREMHNGNIYYTYKNFTAYHDTYSSSSTL